MLVPPGRFRVRFAARRVWGGDEKRFGPGALTERFELEAPLIFEVRDPGIKAGHIIDLSMAAIGQIAQTLALLVCQTNRSNVFRLPVGREIDLAFPNVESRHLIPSWRGQLVFLSGTVVRCFVPQSISRVAG
ncbi:hypothetical protein [uncultured Roseobacter sp.]|uniref:hypothetical protein n=1 Tax=uncultured Roseobacter sp. TaxID=114847 RepID=UPI00260E3FAD|nr:hypothetical protein [uncultured Roseobacter sp.]